MNCEVRLATFVRPALFSFGDGRSFSTLIQDGGILFACSWAKETECFLDKSKNHVAHAQTGPGPPLPTDRQQTTPELPSPEDAQKPEIPITPFPAPRAVYNNLTCDSGDQFPK